LLERRWDVTKAATSTDRHLREDVLLELRQDSRVEGISIDVEVDAGVVTLKGVVDSYAKKFALKEAAYRAAGIHDVADEIRVKPPTGLTRTDAEIAQAARLALEWDAYVPEERIHFTVLNGWVTLDGEVMTAGEKRDAERVVRTLVGVAGVHNRLSVAKIPANASRVGHSLRQADA
jgi:osmotically-inducible protein OsmY